MPKPPIPLEAGTFGLTAHSSFFWADGVTGSDHQPITLGRAQLTDHETQFATDFWDHWDRESWLQFLIQEGSTWSQL